MNEDKYRRAVTLAFLKFSGAVLLYTLLFLLIYYAKVTSCSFGGLLQEPPENCEAIIRLGAVTLSVIGIPILVVLAGRIDLTRLGR